METELTQEQKLDYHANKSTLKLADFWRARPGPNDREAKARYLKPYLSKRESQLMFLRLCCGLPFRDISQRMHEKTPTLRQLWKRTKAKTLRNEQDKQSNVNG